MDCYSYLRVSGAGQVEGDGPERQRLACVEFAERSGYTIAREFFEAGVSGASELANRPALTEMLAAMEQSGVKVIVIEKLDRLARDLMISETILADFRKSGYTLMSSMEPDLCSSDPSRILVRQIFGAISQYEKSILVMKMRGARERMRATEGRCEGRKMYGFYPGEAETLKIMRDLRQSATYTEIADAMNEAGVKSRTGGKWYAATVQKILAR